jgi:hypothetical protein
LYEAGEKLRKSVRLSQDVHRVRTGYTFLILPGERALQQRDLLWRQIEQLVEGGVYSRSAASISLERRCTSEPPTAI